MIDARIPLAIDNQDPPKMGELAGRVMTLRNMARAGRAAEEQLRGEQLENSGREREAAEYSGFQDLVKQNPNATDEELLAASPKHGGAYIANRTNTKKAKLGIEKDEFDLGTDRMTAFGNLLGAVKDEPSLRQAVTTAAEKGWIAPEIAQKYAAVPWNEATAAEVARLRDATMTMAQRRAEERAANQDKRVQEVHEEKQGRTRLANLGADLSAATDQSQYDAVLDHHGAKQRPGFTTAEGVSFPPYAEKGPGVELGKMVSQTYSPAAAGQAQTLAMTPAQRATAANQASTRKEQNRHNQAMEGNAKERNNIARNKANKPAAANSVDRRDTQKRVDRLQKEHDDLHNKEQELNERAEELGRLWSQGLYRPQRGNVMEVDINDEKHRANVESEIKSLQTKAARFREQKQEKLGQKDQLRGVGDGGGAAPAWTRIAINKKTGQRIGTKDGQSWFDLKTNQAVR